MGCAPSKAATTEARAVAPSYRPTLASDEQEYAELSEKLFSNAGKARTLKQNEVLIEEGKMTLSFFYIREGEVSLIKKSADGTPDKQIAKRSKGNIIGEMSFLTGEAPGVTIIAKSPTVSVWEVEHSRVLAQLQSNPHDLGLLFKMMATYLGDRISELSSQLRQEVSAENEVTSKQTAGPSDGGAAHNVIKYRVLFGIKGDEQLLLRTTCSMRKEMNAVKDPNVAFGEMFIFEQHLCFDWKVFGFHRQLSVPFADVLAVLITRTKQVEVQCKGMSYELSFTERQDEILQLMEHCRKNVRARELNSELKTSLSEGGREWLQGDEQEMLAELLEDKAALGLGHPAGVRASGSGGVQALDMTLTEKDWELFLSGSKLRKYGRDETVISEGQPTAALYQIMQGRVRVELQLPQQSKSIVVAHRSAGDMFGEISLLKLGHATASIVADDDSVVMYILEGQYLDSLFRTEPGLPSRFYCFLATTQANRLKELSASAVSSTKREVHASNYARLTSTQVMSNAAYRRIYRKFLVRHEQEAQDKRKSAAWLRVLELHAEAITVKSAPDVEQLFKLGSKAYDKFLAAEGEKKDGGGAVKRAPEEVVEAVTDAMRARVRAALDQIRGKGDEADTKLVKEVRAAFAEVEVACIGALEGEPFDTFLGSDHYGYVLELKAKEGHIPGLADFRLVRVLGQGGFGQVLEVVKRDCGKRYAMKVMHKEMMRRSLGSSWQRKIGLERDLLASLDHPFLVNLKYAFQNTEFLVLVMDLVRSSDLSEFVLGKRRLTRAQVKWVIMEVMVVMRYIHKQGVLYRDLKPENLLVDADGHIRLIDMGLAARITEKHPKRMSRVGTDIYMAPEVRFVKERKEGYGVLADWYTVGVLMYELTTGHTPYVINDDHDPPYREHPFGDERMEDFVRRLCEKDKKKRLGSGERGVLEIFEHPFWDGVDWEVVEKRTMPSPMLSIERIKLGRKKKEKENQAQQTANDLAEAEREEFDDEFHLKSWDFVAPAAIVEEYLENINHTISTI